MENRLTDSYRGQCPYKGDVPSKGGDLTANIDLPEVVDSSQSRNAATANLLVLWPEKWIPRVTALAGLIFLAAVGCGDPASDGNNLGNGNGKTPGATAGELAEDSVVSIRRAFLRRQYDQAKRLIKKHLLVQPNDTEVLEIAGDLYAQIGDSSRATDFYARVVTLNEKPELTLLDKLGQQWMTAGRPFESLEVLESAIAIYPEDASVRQR